MESGVALSLKNVSKTFKLYERPTNTIRQRVEGLLTGQKSSKIKVLESINIEVKRGEFFGIIGKNGSGKSTLLAIMAQSIPPDKGGKVQMNGTYLKLSIGLGFNNTLTAKENIMLNGSVLGIRQKELKLLIPKILEFSGVERFIDTPLKYFSRGMRTRLGFAIALYAKSDFILLDEFIGGVGDLEFRKKAEKAFDEMVLKGRTIVFVSHSMGMVKKYCDRVLVLNKGEAHFLGDPEEAVKQYEAL